MQGNFPLHAAGFRLESVGNAVHGPFGGLSHIGVGTIIILKLYHKSCPLS
jgi:hypothetical protein